MARNVEMVFKWLGWLLQGTEDKNCSCFRIGQQTLCVCVCACASIFSSFASLSPKEHHFSTQAEYSPSIQFWTSLPSVATQQSAEWPVVIVAFPLLSKTFQFTPEESCLTPLPPTGGSIDAHPPQGKFT